MADKQPNVSFCMTNSDNKAIAILWVFSKNSRANKMYYTCETFTWNTYQSETKDNFIPY